MYIKRDGEQKYKRIGGDKGNMKITEKEGGE